ncbi:MAG: hypothetical protein M3P13_12650, partial [Acidobacteriota bacterium]|nr:hypothetical protein [Acidobacteriota bacterium]
MPRRLRGRLVALALLAELPAIAHGVYDQLSVGGSSVAVGQLTVLTHLTELALIGLAALLVVVYVAERWILRDVEGLVGAAKKLAAG